MDKKELIIQLKLFENLPVFFCKKEEMAFYSIVENNGELDMLPIRSVMLMNDKIILTNKE